MEIAFKLTGVLYLLMAGMAITGTQFNKWFLVFTFVSLGLSLIHSKEI